MNKNCEICHKEFYVKLSRERRAKARFCSMKCFGTKLNKTCLECKNEYQVQRWEDKISKYCSRKCHFQAKTKQLGYWTGKKRPEIKQWLKEFQFKGGDKHQNWRGGISEINWGIRHSSQQQIWSKRIKERDNHKCVLCGSIENLQADHIKPFALFPELRLDLSNGRTLCAPCHKKTPTYGFNPKLYESYPI